MPSARHRALADADLLWQFWQHLHRAHSSDVLRAHMEQVTRRFRLAGDIDEDTIERIPAGCGIYVFYGEDDAPLFVGRSVRLRQRVRSHLTGPRRSAKDLRLAALVRRVEWTATGGEIGALLAESQAVARLRPPHNRLVRVAGTMRAARSGRMRARLRSRSAIRVRVARVARGGRWQYFGTAPTLADATALRSVCWRPGSRSSTYRILGNGSRRGLAFVPLVGSAAAVA